MIIKWKNFGLLLGGIAFLLVFIANLTVNLFTTSIIRGGIAFAIFFLLGSIVHLFLFFVTNNNQDQPINKGVNLDVKSSEQDNLDFKDVYQTTKEEPFEPMQFKKIDDVEKNLVINENKQLSQDD